MPARWPPTPEESSPVHVTSFSRARTRLAAAATAGALTLALAACGSSDGGKPSASGSASGGPGKVAITLTSAGGSDECRLDRSSVPAGPVTFTVTNTDSAALSEVELMSDQRILGEKESLAPGLPPVTFTVTLDGGTYQVYCPGAAKETVDLTVTGKASSGSTAGGASAALEAGTKTYATYVDGVVASMVTAVGTLKAAVDGGDLAAAQKAYAEARPFYERVESDVDGFVTPGTDPTDNSGNFDYLVDMRASTLDDAVGWHGFHAVERDLFQAQAITDSTKNLAAELATNVGKLAELSKTLTYKPEDLANGAAALLEEVQANKIKGEEELYSHLDLVDFAANVEGAEQAFANLKPGLQQIDPDLTSTVAARFDDVQALLTTYEDPTALGGYKPYTAELKASDSAKLSQAIQALQEPLSSIAEKVATAR
jgi:iron uptake system component EfeO